LEVLALAATVGSAARRHATRHERGCCICPVEGDSHFSGLSSLPIVRDSWLCSMPRQ
jgi:hypothetical protein